MTGAEAPRDPPQHRTERNTVTAPFRIANARHTAPGVPISLAQEIAAGPATIEWCLRPGEIGEPLEIPEGRRVTVSVHGEARIAVSNDGDEWQAACDGDGPITSGGARHVGGDHRFIRAEYIGNPKNPARSLVPGPSPTAQPVRVELTLA